MFVWISAKLRLSAIQPQTFGAGKQFRNSTDHVMRKPAAFTMAAG